MHVGCPRDGEELESQSFKGNLTCLGKNCEIQIHRSSLGTQLIQNRNGIQSTFYKNHNTANKHQNAGPEN